MDESKLVIMSLAMGTIGLSAVFLPPVGNVALTNQSDDEKQVIHETELIAGVHILIVAGITSYLAKSAFPFLLALLVSGGMWFAYEYAMAREMPV